MTPLHLLLAACLIGSGCAMHVPMSDAVMFHGGSRTPYPSSPYPKRLFVGGGISATQTVLPERSLTEEAERRWITEDAISGSVELYNPYARGGGVYLTVYDDDRVALSGTLGVGAIGADATVKLWGPNYVTAGASLLGGTQVLVQHRLSGSAALWTALGVGYKRQMVTFETAIRYSESDPPCQTFCGTSFFVDTVGGQLTMVTRKADGRVGPLRATVHVGYSPTLGRSMVSLGVALGRL